MRATITAFAVLAVLAACGGSSSEQRTATLSGTNEVPAVTTSATGSAKFTVSGSGDTAKVAWTLTASGLSAKPTAAHIHLAAAGTNGAVVVPFAITVGADNVSVTGSGTICSTGCDTTPSGSTTMSALLTAMRTGGAYANVHTMTNPGGEVRGQIQ